MVERKPIRDTGLVGLVMLPRIHGMAADAKQIRHRFAGGVVIGNRGLLAPAFLRTCAARSPSVLPVHYQIV